ncbi:hypothetical protein, partial [Pseudomonas aeruginosa]|uniref:hypothetical protein n=1 Tax=Pseudomonas aeruginosa TaxID=287 RepID=UPI0020221162
IIADTARTASNVTAAAVSATVVARQTGLLDDEIFAGRTEFVEEIEFLAPAATATTVPVGPAAYAAAPVAVAAPAAEAALDAQPPNGPC